ncbi:MAG: BA14K family protein [Rhizobium sp.]
MKIFGKTILLSAAAVALTVASLSPAAADDRWHHGNGWGYGAAGLATGLIVGSAIASQPSYGPGYYDDDEYAPPPPRYYQRRAFYAPPPPPAYYPRAYAGSLRPWSPAWSRYCYDRYATFDGRTGTFVGYDGARHFCTAG